MNETETPEPGVDPEAPETTGPLTLPDEEREAADPTTPPAEPDEEGEAEEAEDDEGAETNAPAEEGLEGEEPPPAEPGNLSAQAITPEEIEARYKKLDQLRDHVAKRVGIILEEDANDLIPCPLCATVAPGWFYPPKIAPLADGQVEALQLLLGIRDESELIEHDAFHRCEKCNGKGRVKTGSDRLEFRYADCPTCAALGYRQDLIDLIEQNGVQATPSDQVVPGPTVTEVQPTMTIAEATKRGYAIIPPYQPAGA